MIWRVEAVWRESTTPGVYDRAGEAMIDVGSVQEFMELDDAKQFRAALMRQHPGATVTIEPLAPNGARVRHTSRPAPDEDVQLGLKRMRAMLERVAR